MKVNRIDTVCVELNIELH